MDADADPQPIPALLHVAPHTASWLVLEVGAVDAEGAPVVVEEVPLGLVSDPGGRKPPPPRLLLGGHTGPGG